jgi:lysophospholipase L1-like esterase
MNRSLQVNASIALSLALTVLAPHAISQANSSASTWVATWGSSQQLPEPQNALAPADLTDATLRQIVHLSAGGSALRVHLSNAFGTEPLHITSAHIAKPLAPDTSAIDPSTDRALTFSGAPDVIIPAGAEFVSDPIALAVPALSDLAISIHIDAPPARETSHPGSRSTSWYVHGDTVSAPTFTNPSKVDHWFQLSEVDVQTTPGAATIVTLGDSITDGHAATTNADNRWPDILAAHLQHTPGMQTIGVSNQGIGGNHLLTDGLGPNALARFDRDVLAPAGVHWVIVLEGVNDLGGLTREAEVSPEKHAALVQRILAAYQQIITRAHAHQLRVYGATITPYTGSDYYHPGPLSEADRQTINTWIRTPNHFDAVIDFDAIVRDPAHPDRLLPAYDCGDHLHPSPAGYKAMGDSIPLTLFTR